MQHSILTWAQIAQNYQMGTIILGNGSSISVSQSFSYGSLLENSHQRGLLSTDVLAIFNFFETYDFELVLRLVWQAANVNKALLIRDERTYQAYLNVRDSLIRAVREVHPEYAYVADKLPNIYRFLKEFDTVISLNYDLLVTGRLLTDYPFKMVTSSRIASHSDDLVKTGGDFERPIQSRRTRWYFIRTETWHCAAMP